MKHLCVSWRSLLSTALLFCSSFALAQTPQASPKLQTPQPRLAGPIHGPNRVALAGSRNPHTQIAQDLGALPSATTIPGVTLVFNRSATQEADLQSLLANLQDRTSPHFHHWLTPGDFAARFGTAPSDIAAAQTWLAAQGFHIDSVGPTRDRITFTGTAAQLQSAFGAELHRYRTPEGELHFAPATDLTLPEDLAPLTAAVLHLHDFRPKPNIHTLPHPDFTSATTQQHFLTPPDLATIYDLQPLSQAAQKIPGGTNQPLAIVGQSYVALTDGDSAISSFQAVSGANNPVLPVLTPASGSEAIAYGAEAEGEIDIEYAGGINPGATIYYIFVGANQNYDVFDALAYAITANIAPVVNVSYSECETLMSTADLTAFNGFLAQAAAQGQTIVAASGDSGSTGCAQFTSPGQATVPQQQALAVEFPASSPYVTAVGGTQLAPGTFAPGSSSYWASASGVDLAGSALSYIPEVVWNEDSPAFGIEASGGGASSFFPRPSWQTGVPGIPAGTFRLLPDIALQASIKQPGFLICTDDPAVLDGEGETQSCSGDSLAGNSGQYTYSGGTSFAAPVFVGFVSLLNGATQSIQGNINPELYSLAGNAALYPSLFHDITQGSNACAVGDASCAAPGASGFAATPGFDQATGLGSLDFGKVAAAWPVLASTLQITSTLPTVQNNPNPGDTTTAQVDVGTSSFADQGTVPTGTVTFAIDGTVINSPVALSAEDSVNATATYTFPAPTTTGSHMISAVYSGDATHRPSYGTTPFNVGSLLATGSFGLQANPLLISSEGSGTTQVTVTPSGGYNGEVVWSLSLTGPTALTACYVIDPLAVNGPSTASLTIGTGTACTGSLARPKWKALSSAPRSSAMLSARKSPASLAAMAAGLLLWGLCSRRRRGVLLGSMLGLCAMALTVGMTGCGGGGGQTTGSGPTTVTSNPISNFTVTLTGRDSVSYAITSSTSFTLSVQ